MKKSRKIDKKTKFTFILKNVQVENIDKIYGINLISNLTGPKFVPKNTTKIIDLALDNNKHFSYLDESKKEHRCVITMIDYIKKNKLNERTNLHCFFCKHSFSTIPIGCPLRYVSSQLTKNYYSEITKDKYTIRENISNTKKFDIEKILLENKVTDKKINISKGEYYETDGVFCSFNCCLAFIEENEYQPFYCNSKSLLFKIFYDIFGNNKHLLPAPSWRLLDIFGGFLSIDDFRDSFNRIEYVTLNEYIKKIPYMKSVGFLFEEKLRF